MNLQKKFSDWSTKAKNGKEGYEGVIFNPNQGKYVYISGKLRFVIQNCAIIIWENDEIVQSYFMDDEEQIEETTLSAAVVKKQPVPFAAITKMEKKMILYDNKGQFHSFGLDVGEEKKQEMEQEHSEKSVMIFYSFDDIGRLLVASNQLPEIQVLIYEIGKVPDAMKFFVKKIVKLFKKEEKKETAETENKELVSGGIVDGEQK